MRTIAPLLGLAFFTACNPDVPEVPRQVTDADPEVARVALENNAFTLDMHRAMLAADPAVQNLFHSPFSMNAALSMTYAGARGDTATEMESVLHMEQDKAHHEPLGALLRDLDVSEGRDYSINIANRIWGDESYSWDAGFLDLNRDEYGASVELTDIQGDPDGVRNEINDWVEDETKDKIVDLLPPNSVNAATAMVLVNAIHFEADWAESFDKDQTVKADFSRLDGSTVAVDMMNLSTDVAYATGDGFRAAGLDYGTSGEMRLWVLLPDAIDGLPQVEASLDAATLDSLLDNAETTNLAVALPKLEMKSEAKLKKPLSNLGMPTAFGAGADFSGMAESAALTIDEVYHQAYVRIDEEGTEAAAATAVVMTDSADPGQPPAFTVDRPYAFAIRDELTGALLFFGRVTDPSASAPK
ncbi:MAG: serpin family protein [Myxococcota bacterium]